MGILDDMEKDKVWNHMDDMKILGMTREDLDDDDNIIEELREKERLNQNRKNKTVFFEEKGWF